MPIWQVGGLQRVVDSVTVFARESPLVAALVVVGILVFLVGVRLAIDRLRRSPAERFQRLLASTDEVAVLMHPNPDPDAMSSALAVDRLATQAGSSPTLYYPGQIRHQENRAFQTVLDLDFDRIEKAGQLQESEVVLVDHNEARGFPGAESIDPIAVIDHHPGGGEGSELSDVRTGYGACATIFAEYFETLDWELADGDATADDNQIDQQVATGLLYGIQSDTKQLTKGCSSAEFSAAEYLYDGIDEDLLDRIANPQVDAEVLDVKARAITDRQIKNAFAISDVGAVSNVDAIPQAADELLRLEGVTAVVVMGRKEDTLHLSGRSRDDRVHMGNVLQTVVDDIPMGSAGGHARMGGGQLSIDHMNGIGPGSGVAMTDFKGHLFDAMAGDI
ncbi:MULTISPECIES: DHH family phosphoesterase [Halomicrobium]|uniref:Phosphoesterase RecJ domain protein n=2 Tax=Halomicrobium mukohataei TaxID=57705 RepID=C7P1R4_HALMD|nr:MULTISPECIES: DHH family phosphoesterase [Halomicrobium]ACV49154.1 phosphoesterase RecJ domain protein [Halomicrobium mukohataei DSM 12286]QCD64563.1 bifunctional oligoribonuclease/PAP phosphatase NrnA [Halomicrobium mukohataei]QFR19370.1 bifunctional oligoribonuclease/PAP phosphatase NrnA [Halomicrobium sp. ZPS1]